MMETIAITSTVSSNEVAIPRASLSLATFKCRLHQSNKAIECPTFKRLISKDLYRTLVVISTIVVGLIHSGSTSFVDYAGKAKAASGNPFCGFYLRRGEELVDDGDDVVTTNRKVCR